MAEMFGNKKRRIPISKDDIKKAVKSANDKLKRVNKRLDKDISDKEGTLSSIKKDISANSKELKSVTSAIQSEKHDAFEVRADAKKERLKLSKLKTQVAEVVSNEGKAQSNLNNLTKESDALVKNISKMNDDIAIASTIKEEIKILKSDKKIELKELDKVGSEVRDIKAELPNLQADSIKKKKSHKELLAKLDAEVELKQKLLDEVDGKYTIKIAELNTRVSCLKDTVKDKEQEAEVIESLVKQREYAYVEIETKFKQAENALMFTRELTDKEIEREKSEKEKIKKKFNQWKMSVLEEVARMKLKKKIEKIDKAGLAEILNG